MMKVSFFLIPLLLLFACNDGATNETPTTSVSASEKPITNTSLVILGTVQDAGSPHIACKRDCCKELFLHPDSSRKVVSLGLIDPFEQKKFLFEATPDVSSQLRHLSALSGIAKSDIPDGVFLTHAHIGHYTGLMYFGKEATNAKKVPVYAMPKMRLFLEENGPWSQLLSNHNILFAPIQNKQEIVLSKRLKVRPFTVPHRDEYSETVGYQIAGPNKKALFIPDINKWSVWEASIVEAIAGVDYAFIDATFYDGEEINNRDISEIPHPFVVESLALFEKLSNAEKNKIFFIHFNHTNPLLNTNSPQHQEVIAQGFRVAQLGDVFSL